MIRKIVTIPNKILRMKSRRIGFVDDSIRKLANDMIDTSLEWDSKRPSEITAALAAVQIGEPLRLTILREDYEGGEDNFLTLINPEVVKKSSETVFDIQGCLSVPSIYGRVKRHKKIKIKALDEDGNLVRFSLEGFPARVVQHEIDHMNGIIFLDHVKHSKDMFKIDSSGHFTALSKAKPKS